MLLFFYNSRINRIQYNFGIYDRIRRDLGIFWTYRYCNRITHSLRVDTSMDRIDCYLGYQL